MGATGKRNVREGRFDKNEGDVVGKREDPEGLLDKIHLIRQIPYFLIDIKSLRSIRCKTDGQNILNRILFYKMFI